MKAKQWIQRSVLVAAMLLSFGSFAHAGKSKAKFTNKGSTSVTLKLLWTAAGCAGVKYSYLVVCKSKKVTIKAGQTVTYSYKFKWGTSGRNLYVLCNSNSRLIKEKTKNGRDHTFTVEKSKITAYYSKVYKNRSCIK